MWRSWRWWCLGWAEGLTTAMPMPVLQVVAWESRSATGYGLLNMTGTIVGGIAVGMVGYLKHHPGLGTALQAAAGMLVLGAEALWFARPMWGLEGGR